MTDRAVVRKGNWLVARLAGEDLTPFWLEFEDKGTAKRARGSILIHIREQRARGRVNTDYMYNALIYNWIEQLDKGGYIKNKKAEDSNDAGE